MNAIEFRKVTKRFGGFTANRDLSFTVRKGSIHGLIGENGAGKSTAMKVLFGIHPADSGEILVEDRPVRIANPVHAMRMGIGMVHQHFMLAGPETVLDNIILGHEPGRIFVGRAKAEAELRSIAGTYGLDFDRWDRPVSELSVGEQQRVEILKLLYQKSKVLILDEPTAVLTPQEVKDLFGNLVRLKEEGKTIILISHKLKEVLGYCDDITVIRRGETVGTRTASATDEAELARMMVGREVSFTYQGERKIFASPAETKPLVRVDGLTIGSSTEPLRDVSFELKPGEILGVAGVQGNGQSTLLRALAHPVQHRTVWRGRYLINGRDHSESDPIDLRNAGLGLVPEDRLSEGLLLNQDMTENLLLGQHEDPRYSKNGFLLRAKARSVTESKIREYDIRPPFTTVWTGRMSGGNQQKLVIARAMDPGPSILYVAHPTRGVDVGAIEKIHDAIVQERNRGRGILLFSSELDELIDLCDRMLVFYNGGVRAEFARPDFDPWVIGKVMGGGDR
jgi:simple sugar transport system ATP-binding protein